ncbi:MAG: LysR family transcriptional regulator [Emergencia sp.]
MDLVKYEVFLDIVERGSYSKVCEDRGYSLSGISKMMKSMEDEIGIPLITRTNKGISLTPDGEKVLPMIHQLINYKNVVEEEFSLIKGIESGKIRIGCFPTVSFGWISSLIAAFKDEHPNIAIEVTEENSIRNLEQWLNQGIIDVGVFSRQPYHNYDWVGIREEYYVALFPKNHRFAEMDVVPAGELFEEDLVLFKSHEGIDQDVIKVMKYVKTDKIPKYTCNSDFTVTRLVEQLGFVALIPEMFASMMSGIFEVDYRPVDVDVNREIGFAVRDVTRISPAVRQLLKYVKKGRY